jgi:hypothetical protein
LLKKKKRKESKAGFTQKPNYRTFSAWFRKTDRGTFLPFNAFFEAGSETNEDLLP